MLNLRLDPRCGFPSRLLATDLPPSLNPKSAVKVRDLTLIEDFDDYGRFLAINVHPWTTKVEVQLRLSLNMDHVVVLKCDEWYCHRRASNWPRQSRREPEATSFPSAGVHRPPVRLLTENNPTPKNDHPVKEWESKSLGLLQIAQLLASVFPSNSWLPISSANGL